MNTKKTLFCLLALLMGGCLPVMSLHPLYTEDTTVFEEKLLGTWTPDSNEPGMWQFTPAQDEPKAYKLIIHDKDDNKGSFTARLVKLDSRYFLDIFPDQFPCNLEDPNQTDWAYNSIFLIPTHTFLKVESIVPKLRIKLTQDEPLRNLLDDNPDAIDYTTINDRTVLTSNTKQLQQFILKYADDERLFPHEMTLYSIKE
jgi:hypothetical protein